MKKILYNSGIFFLLLLGFCNVHKSSRKEVYYSYYDLFSLSGRDSLQGSTITYPCVSILTDSDSVIISHYLDKGVVHKSTYRKEGIILRRRYSYIAGKSSIAFDEYVQSDTIYTLYYNTSENKELSAIGIFKNNKLITYAFSTAPQGDVSLTNAIHCIDSLKIYSKREIDFSKTGDSIILNINFINKVLPEVSYSRRLSFFSTGKPLEWWLIFKWNLYNESLLYIDDKF